MRINWDAETRQLPQPIAQPYVPRGSMLHVCERCGLQHIIKRAGRYPDDLFLEVWHERFQLEAEVKALRRALLREQLAHSNTREYLEIERAFSTDHLWPLAQAQLAALVGLEDPR